ncbi:hypothetical protein GE107_04805 [Cohnella sp. CFH 77786]|uniref:hypothetical protein n=1 Tax=Cohnella sp. CFH 77786 TaxID=2662265 RepID=UPI001C60D4E1|nr:hypothetical protein [Cohnella sp. CFH 77786]MBW5445381.1 hypothetical protein [Cohnella sp. CFH 77786]
MKQIKSVTLFLAIYGYHFLVFRVLPVRGWYSVDWLFLSAKASLIPTVEGPQILQLNGGRPPIPLLLEFLTPSFMETPLLIYSGIVFYLLSRLSRSRISVPLKWLYALTLVFSLPSIAVWFQTYWLLAFLFVLPAISLLIRYLNKFEVHDLFLFSILYGLSILTDYCTIVLLPSFLVLLPFMLREKEKNYIIAVIGIVILPALMALASWMYLNWLLLGNSLSFLKYVRDRMTELAFAKISGSGSILQWDYILPFVLLHLGILLNTRFRDIHGKYIFTSLSIISVIPYYMLYLLDYFDYQSISIYALTSSIWFIGLLLPYVKLTKFNQTVAGMLLFALLIWSWSYLYRHPREELAEQIVFPKAESYYELAVELDRLPKGSLLMDDKSMYPVLSFRHKKDSDILPYDDEYNLALNRPFLYADYIALLKNPERDQLAFTYWSDIESNRLQDYKLLWSKDNLLLFKRTVSNEADN